MIDSVLTGFLYCVSHLSSISPAFRLMMPLCILLGVLAGFRLERKWYLFAGLLLVMVVVCELVCRLFQMEAVFPLFFTGMIALCVFTGDLLGTVLCKLWKLLRRS